MIPFLRRFCVGSVVVVMSVGVTACRVPSDSSPREIPADQVPFDLLTPSTTAPPVTSPVATVEGTVYLTSGGRLTPVKRQIIAPSSLGSLLAALVQGPTPAETALGYQSAAGAQTSVLSAQVVNGTAVIDISNAFSDIGLQDQIAGLAQIVYTATEIPGVQNVRFQVSAQPASVPRGDGSATLEPLVRSDYAALAPG